MGDNGIPLPIALIISAVVLGVLILVAIIIGVVLLMPT